MDEKYPSEEALHTMNVKELESFINDCDPDVEIKYLAIERLTTQYANSGRGSASIKWCNEHMAFAKKKDQPDWLARSYNMQAFVYQANGQLDVAIDNSKEAVRYAALTDDNRLQGMCLSNWANILSELGMREEALEKYLQIYDIQEEHGDSIMAPAANSGLVLLLLNKHEEAIRYLQEALDEATRLSNEQVKGLMLQNIGIAYIGLKDYLAAQNYLAKAMACVRQNGSRYYLGTVSHSIAKLNNEQGFFDDALANAQQAIDVFSELKNERNLKESYALCTNIYETSGDYKNALIYTRKYLKLEQKLKTDESLKKAHSLKAQLEWERREKEFKIKLANTRLQTLTKIASDIAHEIQNPLQFVNNFSEVNVDLGKELNEYAVNKDFEGVSEVAGDISENSQKIRDYGIRISKIVDQLLEQTRKAESGELGVDESDPQKFNK